MKFWGNFLIIVCLIFEALKRGIHKSWEKVKEYYFIVWIGLGLIFMYPLIVKIFGG